MPTKDKAQRRISAKRIRANVKKANIFLSREMKVAEKISGLEKEIENLEANPTSFGDYALKMKKNQLALLKDQLLSLEHDRNKHMLKLEVAVKNNEALNSTEE